jgi:hypothetical protein
MGEETGDDGAEEGTDRSIGELGCCEGAEDASSCDGPCAEQPSTAQPALLEDAEATDGLGGRATAESSFDPHAPDVGPEDLRLERPPKA